ncbi:predicted protein [Naegleria gruberi]|uniref:Predicted protein n=1 Tax=Naegleria gruberi TaxID=5762 RepID=D2W473_NAEGR|nr:uncharacterized protein NAEGRDRAFT_82296 [Naegleria gruberi]EFC36124.1 predicted protein [Naegleria gruberi]|eukprot:XP_002668868.1 predicted protein [Naegleria gruberi strain NEG-M]
MSEPQGATLRNARSIYNANEMTLAMNVAKSRERCRWAGGYLSVLTIGSMGYWALAKKFPVGALIPISAVATYALWEYDLGYGNKLHRMGQEAQQIQTKERYKYFGKY